MAREEDKFALFLGKWIHLEIITLSEINQIQCQILSLFMENRKYKKFKEQDKRDTVEKGDKLCGNGKGIQRGRQEERREGIKTEMQYIYVAIHPDEFIYQV